MNPEVLCRHPIGMANNHQAEGDVSSSGLGERLLVIFDGHCGFCNWSIRWFLMRDRHDRLRFAPSDSPAVVELLARHGFGELSPNTLVVGQNIGGAGEVLLTRTTGVIAMLRELEGPWLFAAGMLRAIPRPIRDLGYRFIARLRYKIWGRHSICPLPTAAERAHFL